VFWTSEKPKATIFAMGYMLYYALLAAKNLESKGINVLVAKRSNDKAIGTPTQ